MLLNKRTNILFDQQLWNQLMQIAKVKRTSVGELVRIAVRKEYSEDEKQERIGKAVENILAFQKLHGKRLAKGEDSTALIRKMRDTRYGKGI